MALGILKNEDVNFGSLSLSSDNDKELTKNYINVLANMFKNHYEDNLRKNNASWKAFKRWLKNMK